MSNGPYLCCVESTSSASKLATIFVPTLTLPPVMTTFGVPVIDTEPETGTGFAAVFATVTLPDTLVVPCCTTGTGLALVFTTVTGADGGFCGPACAGVNNAAL